MNKQKNVMLTITEKCNLNCTYCFETKKRNRSMEFETAKKIIDAEMIESNEYEEILFDFMGGEPFVEFELMRKICEYTWSKKWPKKYLFFASTNGTLIKNEVQDWLRLHKDKFVCGLSLDGTKEMHDKNRCNSFDDIDISFFVETWPLQEAKMTVAPETIPQLYDGITFIHNLGFKLKTNLAYGPDWRGEEIKQAYQLQLQKLIDFYTENDNIEPTSLLNVDLSSVAYPKEPLRKWCGMGGQMVAYDIDGKKYPCHFFQEMSSNGMPVDDVWNVDYSTIHQSENNPCRKCILKNSCPTCYGYNYSISGNYCVKDPAMCELNKLAAVATSTLSFRKMKRKYNNDFSKISKSDEEIIKAVCLVQQAAETGIWNID